MYGDSPSGQAALYGVGIKGIPVVRQEVVTPLGQLDGRVAVITGAGAGLGREHVLLFAGEGAEVVVNDLANAEGVVKEIAAAGGEAVAVEGSVADLAVGRTLVDAAVESFGDL
ncbi:SDR family NAD(P)-dependent oxidoreductase, partial [Streptomyces sp. NPDC047315]|uniref:SDR family NAD(P)-dependent oxidoreductase n=1 Tax=Streptomyces sp. NPDC047315 TaxID=3155142 RepID=UPI0033CC404D